LAEHAGFTGLTVLSESEPAELDALDEVLRDAIGAVGNQERHIVQADRVLKALDHGFDACERRLAARGARALI
jgi:hypothetical protein